MSLIEHIQEIILEWQCGIDPESKQDWVSYHGFDSSLMTVYMSRHPDLDPLLFTLLERRLQQEVSSRLLVSRIKIPNEFDE